MSKFCQSCGEQSPRVHARHLRGESPRRALADFRNRSISVYREKAVDEQGNAYKISGIFLRFVFACMILTTIIGCTASGPSYDVAKASFLSLAPEKSRLFFLRESALVGAAVAARIQINGRNAANLYGNGFTYIDIPAGDAFVVVDGDLMNPGEWRLSAQFAGGREYFFMIRPNINRAMAAVLFGMPGVVAHGGGHFKRT